MNHDVVAKVNHDQTILFIVHVDYVIVFEDFRDQDDVFDSYVYQDVGVKVNHDQTMLIVVYVH